MTASYMRAYLRADDEGLVRSILEGPRRPSADLMGRLWRRDLVKQVVSAPLSRCSDAAFKQKITQLGFRQELEQEIANICSKRQPWLVFVDYQAGRPVRKGAGQEGPEVIPVVGTDRVTRNYDSLSPVFRQGAPRGEEHLRIYAPVQGDSDDTRKRIRSELERNIAALVGLEGPVPPTPGPGA